jgi:hypothetical protein
MLLELVRKTAGTRFNVVLDLGWRDVRLEWRDVIDGFPWDHAVSRARFHDLADPLRRDTADARAADALSRRSVLRDDWPSDRVNPRAELWLNARADHACKITKVLRDESPRYEIIIRRIAHADDLTVERD